MEESQSGTMRTALRLAKPLHLQRLEASLDMNPFMAYAQNILSRSLTSSDDSENDSEAVGQEEKLVNGVITSKQDRHQDKMHVYNFSQIGPNRKWLQDLLLSDTESETEISDEDDFIREMIKDHVRERKYRTKYYQNANNAQYGYYGAGLLSNCDMFPEHQRSIVGSKKRKRERERKGDKPKTIRMRKNQKLKQHQDVEADDVDIDCGEWDDTMLSIKEEFDDGLDSKPHSPLSMQSKRARKKSALAKTPEFMAIKRRKVWQLMAKKELGKVQRAKANNHKEVLTGCKRVATLCMKIARQRAMQSQKNMKETMWRAKRLTREMQGYWKRYDRVERETRRRMEKEAEEQRKMDVEMIEAKRQQRKLNFLITQTELYAHFMSRKLGRGTEAEQLKILNQLDEETNPRLAAIDTYNAEFMKQKAQKNASDAFNVERARTRQFDMAAFESAVSRDEIDAIPILEEVPQPSIFKGSLKGYQIKGMTWLANLYNQGISGILADEMGLGKTVQSIAFLCHIAEKYGVWGPFLIISPASTLHNWQQEMQRFVPEFNVVPYWGSPNERKILRQFWEQKDLHTKDASFHVVITSYQLVVSDYKYFNRIKWQYMVLDEAQAIKSSASVRWKLLLGFNCRNRLLLSGTPIQNSMAELWALLHFIMPTLFDSHDEFNEWFSKDIESHAENKTGIDEKQISRLHMILKPFMLRRIKKDVENELSDKIEIMVYCPLTTRQKLLYVALKKKIRIEDLLHFTVGGGDGHSVDKNFTSNLMNLVMQFRKVCNHPELFERRDAKSPLYIKCLDYQIPRLVFEECSLSRMLPSKKHLLYNKFSVFVAENVHRSVFSVSDTDHLINYKRYEDLNVDNCFSFARFSNLGPIEIERIALGGLICFFNHCQQLIEWLKIMHFRSCWWDTLPRSKSSLLLEPTYENKLNRNFFSQDSVLHKFLFTAWVSQESVVYTHTSCHIVNVPETMEHRIIRSKNRRNILKTDEHLLKIDVKEEPLSDVVLKPFKSISKSTLFKSPLKSPPGSLNTAVKPPMKSPPLAKILPTALALLPEFVHLPRPAREYHLQPTAMPKFVYGLGPKVQCPGRKQYVDSRAAQWIAHRHEKCENLDGWCLMHTTLTNSRPIVGWSNIIIPDKQTLVSDAGKLFVLDNLLTRLKAHGHRVLIYSQMTKMIDLLEEYMWHRKHRYMRLDGSSKISARRDMVADFQTRADIFVFLLSTRAGGLGINLTAADTVIFYDSDWNPTVDQQAMDRAHRLGQTKQVTVYRLICKGTIEERILQRAREKSEIQRMVISGGNFKPDTLKPKEVVSLLLDDEEIELKYRQKTEERKTLEDPTRSDKDKDRKRKQNIPLNKTTAAIADTSTKPKRSDPGILDAEDIAFLVSGAPSPTPSDQSYGSPKPIVDTPASGSILGNDESSNEALIVDCDSPAGGSTTPVTFSTYGSIGKPRRRHHPRGTKRGRPRGSRRGGSTGSSGRFDTPSSSVSPAQTSSTSATADASAYPQSNNSASFSYAATHDESPTIAPMRRGPGRPRLKPSGPGNQGSRGPSRIRKSGVGLVVPLSQSPAQTPPSRSPAISPAPSPAHEKGIGFYQAMDDE